MNKPPHMTTLESSLSVSVKIDYEQLLFLIVNDLMSTYHGHCKRGNTEWTKPFAKVLQHYLTEEEFAALAANPPADARYTYEEMKAILKP